MIYSDWILVGVDGSRGSDAAVHYAAREARRRDVGLRLAHVAPARIQLAPIYPGFELSEAGIAAAAHDVLDRAAAMALEVVALGRLSTTVLDGERVDALSAEADRATLVVLGDQRRRRRERTVTSWTCDQVLARSKSPVVLVPAGWTATHEHDGVVAGVRSACGSPDLIRTAMAEAHRRRTPLELIHAWQPADTDIDGLDPTAGPTPVELRGSIWEAAHAIAAEFPGVAVDVRVDEGCPIDVLHTRAADAGLLVLERPRGDEERARETIGTLLRGRGCPVEFVPSITPGALSEPKSAVTIRRAPVSQRAASRAGETLAEANA